MKKKATRKLKFLPTDVSTFKTMIEGDYLYVDKTKHIYDLYKSQARYFFLSRPRRFGKTLLISTLEELFLGNKKLFKGLWIEKSDWQWKKHPVIRLDLSMLDIKDDVRLESSLCLALDDIAEEYDADISKFKTPGTKFKSLVTQLAKKEKVVLLVDEYDYPIISHITDPEKARANREVLKNFFTVAKGLDTHWRSIFLTGVSKFSKTSIFSGINNLNDISEKPVAAVLLGYTQQELESYFKSYLAVCAKDLEKKPIEMFEAVKRWYNGYRFSKVETRVYNPFSVLYFLKDRQFQNYWFTSGTPTFLLRLLTQRYELMSEIAGHMIESDGLGPFELDNIPLIPLLYQTGYLTIKDACLKGEKVMYTLDYPNQEVHESFSKYLVATFANSNLMTTNVVLDNVKDALKKNDIEALCFELQIFFANIPYNLHIPQERYYHSLIHAMLYLMGLEAHSEVVTSKGRLDVMVALPERVFVFEFKFDGTAEQALNQIKKQRYYEKYLGKKKPITLAGIFFDYEDKRLTLDWVAAEVNTQRKKGR